MNIRSIRKNFDNFLILYEQYDLRTCDVIILSECFQLENETYQISGYSTYYDNGDYNRNDGIVVLVRSCLVFDVHHIKLELSKCTVSRISLVVSGISFGITAVYKPPPIS